jgi:hypothetical protein
MERKCRFTVLNYLIERPEFSTVDICSLKVHRHAALPVLLELAGCDHEIASQNRTHGAPLSLSNWLCDELAEEG